MILSDRHATGPSVPTSPSDTPPVADEYALPPVADLLWLLRGSRLTLDAIANGREGADHAAAQAQRIVDHLGHAVTDEPPHTLIENDRLTAELERSNALRGILLDALREARAEVARLRSASYRAWRDYPDG